MFKVTSLASLALSQSLVYPLPAFGGSRVAGYSMVPEQFLREQVAFPSAFKPLLASQAKSSHMAKPESVWEGLLKM